MQEDNEKYGAVSSVMVFFKSSTRIKKEELEGFTKFFLEKFNKEEVKKTLCSAIDNGFNCTDISLPTESGFEKPTFDKDYFMEGEVTQEKHTFKDTPNIFIPHIRSKNIEKIISPVVIFPYSFIQPQNTIDTKIVMYSQYKGNIKNDDLLNFSNWSSKVSDPVLNAVAREYQKIMKNYLFDLETTFTTFKSGEITCKVGSDGKVDLDEYYSQFPQHIRDDPMMREIFRPPVKR